MADGSKVSVSSSEYSKKSLGTTGKAPIAFTPAGKVTLDSDAIYSGKSATLLSSFTGEFAADKKFDKKSVTVDATKVSVKSSSVKLVGTTGNDTLKSGGGKGGSVTLQGGKGNDKLFGKSSVKDTFYYSTGDGKDVVADFTSNEDVLKIAKKKSVSSVSTVKGGLGFTMKDKGKVDVKGLSASKVFVKSGKNLYWFEDVDGDKKGEWVTGKDSATKKTLQTIMKSNEYAIVDVDYGSWGSLSQSVKFTTGKTINDFKKYKTK